MSRRVLVVEDEDIMAKLISIHLETQGFHVTRASDGEAGLRLALTEKFDLVILDVVLPGKDGIQVCREIREASALQPILMLSAQAADRDKVRGLLEGADDYLAKPFNPQELVARVRSLLRRVEALIDSEPVPPLLERGAWRIDLGSRTVHLQGREIELTPREFDLLVYFFRHRGLALTRSQLLDAVWRDPSNVYEHMVSATVNRLRAKIEREPTNPSFLLTVWGIGYNFVN